MFFPLIPLGRFAIFRSLVYFFVVIDILFLHGDGKFHAEVDPLWYQPLRAGELLNLPAANPLLVSFLIWGAVLGALASLTGKLPRFTGYTVAICWCWFQIISFSYGKVDHDRGDFVVALILLPTVGAAGWSEQRFSEAAGFALRSCQIAAIATYFLSAIAKLRFGGEEWGFSWVNSATLVRAVVRRGTPLGEVFLNVPWFLHAMQWFIMLAELLSWTIFLLPEKWRRLMVLGWFLFHAGVYSTISIAFWPHLVLMLAFLPLEEYRSRLSTRLGHVGYKRGPMT